MNRPNKLPISSDPISELMAFLGTLPYVPRRSGKYKNGDLHLTIGGELGRELSVLSRSVAQSSKAQPGAKENGFRPDTLVRYLLKEFLSANQVAVDSLIAIQVASDHKAQLDEEARLEAALESLLI